jgi:hypothetical protein
VGEGLGKERRRRPTRRAVRSGTAGAVASNRIEGSGHRHCTRRIGAIAAKPLLRDRGEEEVRDYRNALAWIHERSPTIPVSEDGRVSHLVLLLQAYHAGMEVGRYISLERLIEQNKERYYA